MTLLAMLAKDAITKGDLEFVALILVVLVLLVALIGGVRGRWFR